jgi:hypothetical protein
LGDLEEEMLEEEMLDLEKKIVSNRVVTLVCYFGLGGNIFYLFGVSVRYKALVFIIMLSLLACAYALKREHDGMNEKLVSLNSTKDAFKTPMQIIYYLRGGGIACFNDKKDSFFAFEDGESDEERYIIRINNRESYEFDLDGIEKFLSEEMQSGTSIFRNGYLFTVTLKVAE